MIPVNNLEKMLQHDVENTNGSKTDNLFGFAEMREARKKEVHKKIGVSLIQKAVDEENKIIDEKVKERTDDYLSTQLKFENIIVTETNLDNESNLLISLPNKKIKYIQNKSQYFLQTPIELLNRIIYDKVSELQTLDDTSFIEYDGREPRIDVLEKLELIIKKIPNPLDNRISDVKNAIHSVLGKKDPRTLEKYLKVFLHYSKKVKGHSSYGLISVSGMDIAIKSKITSYE